jgi:hypothetical protein
MKETGGAQQQRAEAEDDPPSGVLRWLISCDESGTGGATHYGFGTLWMAWQRRGDFAHLIATLRDAYGNRDEIKWNKVNRRNLDFYKALVEEFFRSNDLVFHCLVVRKADVIMDHHKDRDVARRKHFTMLLTNKIQRALRASPNRDQTFRIWVDPIASHYAKADEAVEVIANNVLAKVFGKNRTVDSVLTRDSKLTPSIGLCDLLLGAVMESWQHDAQREAKLALRTHIAGYLGWDTLDHDTFRDERKFNVWYFHDPTRGETRGARSKAVALRYPLRGRAAAANPASRPKTR